MSGKGDTPRPFSVSQEDYGAEFDRIFGQKECSPIPQYPTDRPEGDPEIAPDWHAKGL